MQIYEKESLQKIRQLLTDYLPQNFVSLYAFGSRVRGDFGEWSDFDILVIEKDKAPSIEAKVIDIFVEEEMQSGVSFSPVIKDLKAFEKEKNFHTPFYEAIEREGVLV
ncbi:MAG: nucleotidyltransferase domain-containing protein [Nitrospirae bacterium]|nr:nucleotidyltransferase domain-containing protein [Nitrospirota bacterium]